MSTGVLLVLILLGIVCSILGSYKFKINAGIIAICFAWAIGCFGLDMKVKEIVSFWPTSIVFRLMALTMFFSFAVQNGTLKRLADNFLYTCRNRKWLIPMGIYMMAFAICACGSAPPVGNSIMAVISFSIAVEAGLDPWMTAAAVCFGASAGAFLPYAEQGSVVFGIVESYFPDTAGSFVWKMFICFFLFSFLYTVLLGILRKGFKLKDFEIIQPEPLTAEHKKTLAVILIVVALVLIPTLLKLFIDSPFLAKMTKYFDVQMLAIVGSLVLSAMKLGDLRTAITKGCPWYTFVMFGGMTVLLGVATHGGVTDYIAEWLGSSVPAWSYGALFMILGGFLSCFSSALTVVFPMLAAIAVPLAAATGINSTELLLCIGMGASLTAVSPFSSGGALVMGNCPEKSLHETLFNGQIVVAFSSLAIGAVLALLGVFRIF